MDEIREAWDAFWGLVVDLWLDAWERIGGWPTIGPVLFVCLLVGMALASNDKPRRKGRR